jgi:general secretion pathway protein G
VSAAPRNAERGLTFVELMASAGILLILASAILPLAKVSHTRRKEIELRRALREMRTAIDGYHAAVAQGLIGGSDVKLGSDGYPPDLETLIKGVNQVGAVNKKLKFLRRVPRDPFASEEDDPDEQWGMRCYQDDPDSSSWCGDNVWDVYSKSQGTALDGSKYVDW